MLDKHASLLNAGQTQNDDPVAPSKKKLPPRKRVKVEVIDDKAEVNETNTDGKKRGQSKKGVGGKPPPPQKRKR
jgi:hypothetical protein